MENNNVQQPYRPPPEEQVFSNPLLLDKIWKSLDTKDLLQARLVSIGWCAKSREILLSSKQKHEVYFRINKGESPCRKLMELNDFLDETYGSSPDTVIFNGINLTSTGLTENEAHKLECSGCLINDWENHSNNGGIPMDDENQNRMINDKLFESFGQVLDRIRFKYIILERMLSLFCPLARLMRFVLQERSNGVLKLDFGDSYKSYNKSMIPYLLWDQGQSRYAPRIFPNLQVLGIHLYTRDISWMPGLPVVAPSLKRIDHFNYNPLDPFCLSLLNCPRHAITKLRIPPSSEAIKATIEFAAKFKPPITSLCFDWYSDEIGRVFNEELQEDLFELGSLISPTLENLSCSPGFLTFLVCGADSSGRTNWDNLANGFPSMKYLYLRGVTNVAITDTFNKISLYQHFPDLVVLDIRWFKDIISLCLDPLFLEKNFGEGIRDEVAVAPYTVSKGSNFTIRNKRFRKITIWGEVICTNSDIENKKRFVRTGTKVPKKTFLVSGPVAQAISEDLLGFTFELRLHRACSSSLCNNNIGPGGSHFEHLASHATIKYSNTVDSTHYDIEF